MRYVKKSKPGHESTFYLMDFDELGVVGKLALSAFQRHQNYHQPSNIDAFRGNILIFGHFRSIFFDQKISIFDAFFGMKNGEKSAFGVKMTKNDQKWTRNASVLFG